MTKRFDAAKWLMLAGFFVLSFILFDKLIAIPSSDLSIHTTWAGEGDFSDPTSFVHHTAHPIWHILVHSVRSIGLPLNVAAAVVTALCKVAEVWLIHWLMTKALGDRLSRNAITLCAAACAVVSCVCVPFYNPLVYDGVGTPNTWHSPTQLIAMSFMIFCVPLTARCYDRFVELEPVHGKDTILPWREPILMGACLLVSLLAKPTFMQAFLPGACIFFLIQWIRHPNNSKYFFQIIACVLPAVIFMILQYLYYFGIIVPWQSSMVLEINLEKVLGTIIRVVLMLAFPLYTLFSSRRQPHDTTFWLTIALNVAAIIEFLILGENGRRAADGNFGWGMMGAALMMWVVCLIRFFRQEKRDIIGWGLLAWHLVSGVYYIGYLFTSGNAL